MIWGQAEEKDSASLESFLSSCFASYFVLESAVTAVFHGL